MISSAETAYRGLKVGKAKITSGERSELGDGVTLGTSGRMS